jgi:hypothetical protein
MVDVSNQTPTANAPAPAALDWVGLASGALSLYNQQRLAETNLKRAKQNLPPITLDQIPGAVPSVRVGIEGGTLGMIGALGVGALALIGMRTFMKRSRR